ncbi:hypothetical protein LZ32DRAFT_459107 [Colletotrichum eremochloae]|nr:hypothetical protein LZ32DRAFT_459107 [Colletotrichum eremochloae]
MRPRTGLALLLLQPARLIQITRRVQMGRPPCLAISLSREKTAMICTMHAVPSSQILRSKGQPRLSPTHLIDTSLPGSVQVHVQRACQELYESNADLKNRNCAAATLNQGSPTSLACLRYPAGPEQHHAG